MAKQPEFRPLGGTSRRYLYRGREISRRQRDDILARRAGFKSRADVEKARLNLNRTQPNWIKRVIQNTGKRPTWQDYKAARDVDERRQRLIDKHGGRPPEKPWGYDSEDPGLVAADGPLANYLDVAGLRPKNGRPVGGS